MSDTPSTSAIEQLAQVRDLARNLDQQVAALSTDVSSSEAVKQGLQTISGQVKTIETLAQAGVVDAWHPAGVQLVLMDAAAAVLLLLMTLAALVVIVKMWSGKIDITQLISEGNGVASLSRFQFLLFTFVIATSYVLFVIANLSQGIIAFPIVSGSTLTLIGISGGSYLVSKAIPSSKNSSSPGGSAPGWR